MSGKQNIVLLIGLLIIAMVFWVNGYWGILAHGITGGLTGNPALRIPGPGGIPPNPKTHKCPGPNYFMFNGKCFPASVNLPGSTTNPVV